MCLSCALGVRWVLFALFSLLSRAMFWCSSWSYSSFWQASFVDQYHATIFIYFKNCFPKLTNKYSKLALTILFFLWNIQKASFMLLKKVIPSLNDIKFLITFHFNFPVSSTIFNSNHCLKYVSLIIFLNVVAERTLTFFYCIYSFIYWWTLNGACLNKILHCTTLKGVINLFFFCKNCWNRIFSKYPTFPRSSLIIDKGLEKMRFGYF